jgi:sensor histidine kinase YesM
VFIAAAFDSSSFIYFLLLENGGTELFKLKARTKLIIFLVIPSVLFSLVTIHLSKGYLSDFFRETQQDSLKRVSEQIVYSLKGSIDQVNMLAIDLEQRILQDSSTENVKDIIDIIARNRSDFIRGIAYIDKSGRVMGYPEVYWEFFGEAETGVINESIHKNEVGVYWSPHFYSLINQGNSFNPASIATKSVFGRNGYEGTIAIVVDLYKFVSNTAIIGGNYEIRTLLYDSDGTLADKQNSQNFLFNNASKLQSEAELQEFTSAVEFLKEKKLYYSVSEMEYHPGWKIMVIGDVQKLESKFKPFNNSFVIVIIFGVAGLFCAYFLVMWWFTIPLVKLTKGIRKVGTGDFEYRLDMRRQDEFGKVADEFNRMSGTIKNLIQEVNLTNEKKRNSDFQVLLSQVNPHFLYNTLNSIDMMVEVDQKKDVHRALEILVSLLKYGLDKKTQLRTLKDEFDYIIKYIEILKIRYGSRFEYNIAFPEELENVKLLKLLLQPLVENAIFHGLHPLKEGRGNLNVRAWRDDTTLFIEVCDNGVGIPEEQLKRLLENPADCLANGDGVSSGKGTGIGIVNVHERIQLYYGRGYGLDIKSEENAGTCVTVKIPAGLENTGKGSSGQEDWRKEAAGDGRFD